MATETARKQFGMTSKGQVVVITKESYDDRGSQLVPVFEVRHGVRTIGEYSSARTAETVARALLQEKNS